MSISPKQRNANYMAIEFDITIYQAFALDLFFNVLSICVAHENLDRDGFSASMEIFICGLANNDSVVIGKLVRALAYLVRCVVKEAEQEALAAGQPTTTTPLPPTKGKHK